MAIAEALLDWNSTTSYRYNDVHGWPNQNVLHKLKESIAKYMIQPTYVVRCAMSAMSGTAAFHTRSCLETAKPLTNILECLIKGFMQLNKICSLMIVFA